MIKKAHARNILFVCVENAGRSQIAEGFGLLYGGETIHVFSAGSDPRKDVHEYAIEVMREKGIDISGNRPKIFSELSVARFDYVVNMGCGDECPVIPAREVLNWDIPDPKNGSIENFRKIRDIIEKKVKTMIEAINS